MSMYQVEQVMCWIDSPIPVAEHLLHRDLMFLR